MLWLPVLVAVAASEGEVAMFGKILVGGLIFWIPFWLAWWLSDGFARMYPGGGASRYGGGVSPFTGRACCVRRDPGGITYYSDY
jgi:hypothetical protein